MTSTIGLLYFGFSLVGPIERVSQGFYDFDISETFLAAEAFFSSSVMSLM